MFVVCVSCFYVLCVQYTRFVRLDLKLEMSVVCLRFVGNMGLIKLYFGTWVSSGARTHLELV